jgi:hypothetical protein
MMFSSVLLLFVIHLTDFLKTFQLVHNEHPGLFCFIFETGLCSAAQAGLEFEIFLPQPPECWESFIFDSNLLTYCAALTRLLLVDIEILFNLPLSGTMLQRIASCKYHFVRARVYL